MKLDFEQRKRASELYEKLASEEVDIEEISHEVIGLRDQVRLLRGHLGSLLPSSDDCVSCKIAALHTASAPHCDKYGQIGEYCLCKNSNGKGELLPAIAALKVTE